MHKNQDVCMYVGEIPNGSVSSPQSVWDGEGDRYGNMVLFASAFIAVKGREF